MENKNKFMNCKYKKYNNFKALLFKYLIILLIIPNNLLLYSRNKFVLFSQPNIIMLKVNEKGTFPIINPDYAFKPDLYVLNNDLTPKMFLSPTIEFQKPENRVILIFNNPIGSCNAMFQGCTKITYIDLSNFVNPNSGHIEYMFYGCSSLKSIKFGNFQTSNMYSISDVFRDCSSLISLDLSSFVTSKISHMHRTFLGCRSLKYLDLSNFDTSSLICVYNMFDGCTSITSINLSGFDTSKVVDMSQMFKNCKNLISLDLSSFSLNSVSYTNYMFSGCEKLEFVNLKIASISNIANSNYMISNTVKNIVFCVDESKTPILNNLMSGNTCSIRIIDCPNWRKYQKKIVPGSNTCADSCKIPYPFEYLGKCFDKCPNSTVPNKFTCYDCIQLGNCQGMTADDFKSIIKEKITRYVNATNVISGANFLANVFSTDEINPEDLFKKSISSFDLGNCSDVVKQYYEIEKEDNLIILNMEYKNGKINDNSNSNNVLNLAKSSQLEIFDKNGEKLDLFVCKENIKFFQKLDNEGKLNFDLELAKDFIEKGIDIFNPDDEFYHDICWEFDSPNGIDIAISDRKKLVNQNIIFCRLGCFYGGINYTIMAVICTCNTTYAQEDENNPLINDVDYDVINFQNLKDSLVSNLFSFNFGVLKCYNLVFNLKILFHNFGFYSLVLMLILEIILFIIYLVKKLNQIKNFMISLNGKYDKNKKDNHNKTNITIIKNNKSNKKKNKKNKSKFFPPKKSNIILTAHKYSNKKNRQIKIMKSESNYFSSKSSFAHQNKQNLNIYNQNKEKEINNDKKDNKIMKFSQGNNIIENNNLKLNLENDNNKGFNLKKYESIKLLKNIYDIQDIDYEEAIFYDKRGYLKIYWGCLVDQQVIFGTFFSDRHLDLLVIKLSFLLISFQISFFLNALFYTDEYISKAYYNNGVLNFVSGLPKSIYSFAFTLVITNLLRMLSTSKKELLKLIIDKLQDKSYLNLIHDKLTKLKKKLIAYYIIVFFLSFICLYYVTCFCAVYRNSQKYWFFGCLESLGIDTSVSLIGCIFLAFLRYVSIKKRIKYLFILYNIISNLL